MKILVTGATGVIGAAVVRALVSRGDAAVAVSSRGDLRRLGDMASGVTSVTCDLRDTERVRRVVAEHRPAVVIHLAALLPGAAERQPEDAVDLNVRATAALWEAARRSGARRFVYASTKSVYGPPNSDDGAERRLDERQCPKPDTVYGATKLAGETVLRAQSAHAAPEVVALRFATIFAPGKGAQAQGSKGMRVGALSALVDAAIAGRRFDAGAGGDQIDDIIYVEDAAAGVVAAAGAPSVRAPVYHIATGIPRTPQEIADLANCVFERSNVRIGPGLSYMGPAAVYGVMSVELARRDFGFSVSDDLERTLRRYQALARELAIV